MFGLSTIEVLIILAVALIVLGPQQLPKIAAQLGKGMRDLQRAANDFKRDMAESAKDLPNLRDLANDMTKDSPPRPAINKPRTAPVAVEQTADAATESGLPADPYLARNRERFGTDDASRRDPYADLAKANREPTPPPLSSGESNPLGSDEAEPLGEFDSAGYPTDADEAASEAEGYPPDDESDEEPAPTPAVATAVSGAAPKPALAPASQVAALPAPLPTLPILKPADGAIAFGSPEPDAPPLPPSKS